MSHSPAELAARYHRAFNDRDFDVWREVFDENVELVVDGMPFRGVDAAVGYGLASVRRFPGLTIASAQIVALSGDAVVVEIGLVDRDGGGEGPSREQGTACEICRVRDGRIASVRSYRMPAPPGSDEAAVMAGEQAALRRVATLVARATRPEDVFAAVAAEVGGVLGADVTGISRYDADGTAAAVGAWRSTDGGVPFPVGTRVRLGGHNVVTQVFETGRPARIDGGARGTGEASAFAWAREFGSVAGAPISVEGRLWGVVLVISRSKRPLPADTEARLSAFTDLVATAIANAQARTELRARADEQAVLRGLATLVARAAPPEELFGAVTRAMAQVLGTDQAGMTRYEGDGTATVVAGWNVPAVPVGTTWTLGGRNVGTQVFETGRPARIDFYPDASGMGAEVGRRMGATSAIGVPIMVEGRLWGFGFVTHIREAPLPAGTEARLTAFTELVATAIANAQARSELRGFADEQAALRRVATLVARATPALEVFAAVAEEAGKLLDAEVAVLNRFDVEGTETVVGLWSGAGPVPVQVGDRNPLGGLSLSTLVAGTGKPARMDGDVAGSGAIGEDSRRIDVRAAVGVPISVEGQVWGAVIVATTRERPLPPGAEERLAGFTELVATAIANADARTQLCDYGDEQAALRRVATLVARETRPPEVFTAVAEEVGHLLQADFAVVSRYDGDGYDTVIGGWARIDPGRPLPIGMRVRREGRNIHALVLETGRPARVDDYSTSTGEFADVARKWGFRSSVGTPISVEGRLWGVMIVGSRGDRLPADTERRLTGFTELAATAIANAEAQAALTASRARIVAAADTTRRRIERNLHDGAQQRLVSLALQLQNAQDGVPAGAGELGAQLRGVADGLTDVLDELREIARGLHPAVLAKGGLRPALRTLARRSAIPASVDVRAEGRFPEPVEVATYYVVSEALTNAAKHASASGVDVIVETDGARLQVRVRDDGIGGADLAAGGGLVGMRDRVEALGGKLSLRSPLGAGTTLEISLPLIAPSVAP